MTHNIDDEWSNFISMSAEEIEEELENSLNELPLQQFEENAPKVSPIYISTKTNISYLNMPIDLKQVFWKIEVIPYARPMNGVIKKQMKFNSLTQEELDDVVERVSHEECVDENIITSINNPNGRIKFKDIRKVSIGVSKKDLMSYRSKKKSAFYNCFVMILRIKLNGCFKEYHVKIFNTGKIEIPGIQSDESFNKVLEMVVDILHPHVEGELTYDSKKTETVLINSNFNCGFYINREAFYDILKSEYKIQCIYDPCSYPGIQCKFYYNTAEEIQTGVIDGDVDKTDIKEISFMIFRTGSVLIVGKCDEPMLHIVYEFLKKILANEYKNIGQLGQVVVEKDKKSKIRRKQIIMNI